MQKMRRGFQPHPKSLPEALGRVDTDLREGPGLGLKMWLRSFVNFAETRF